MDEELIQLLQNTKAVSGPGTLLDVFRRCPEAADELLSDRNAATLYWKVQEFYNTDVWQTVMMRKEEEARKHLLRMEQKRLREQKK